MLAVHGHPEYGTEIIWHDDEAPEFWKNALAKQIEGEMNKFHDYHAIPTSAEVASVIQARHSRELIVYSSYSAPESGVMETTYGFKDEDFPVIGYRTTWDGLTERYERINEQHKYWLLAKLRGAEDESSNQTVA
jgi:hypothetical protein